MSNDSKFGAQIAGNFSSLSQKQRLKYLRDLSWRRLGRISSLLQPLRLHVSSLSRCPNDSSTSIKFLQPDTSKSFKFGAHNKEGNFVTNLHRLRFIFFKFPNVRSYRKEKINLKKSKFIISKKKKKKKFKIHIY